jgi:hypothetical protein
MSQKFGSVVLACWVLAALLLASSARAEDVKIGDTVLAHWPQGNAYFVGTAVEDKGAGLLIVFEDGDTLVVSKTKVRANDIKVGSQVIARWKDGEYYRATVAKIVGRALYVHYSDGDKGWVPWSAIAVK